MKPIKLILSAFGPYKNEVEIDFSKIGENGIFLITGDTGAGKTTIFDAISYGLFGEVSGSNRQVSTIRSTFAEPQDDTYVKLEFFHKGKIYKITRIPQYERLKARGEGTTTNTQEAFLEYDDIVISKIKNVNEKIEEILGINAKQFKQIAMLAQGEFIKILFADSKERAEIFRKIFDTDIYNLITKKLYDKQREYKENLQDLKTSFITNTANINWENLPENIEKINNKDLIKSEIEEILELLEKEIEKNKENYNKIEQECLTLEKEIKKQEDKIKKIQEENSKIDRYNELNIEQEKLLGIENEIKKDKDILEKNQKILAIVLPKEEMVLKIKKEILNIQQEIKQLEQKIKLGEIKENELKEKEKNIEILKKELNNYFELEQQNSDLKTKVKKNILIKECIKNKEKYEKEQNKIFEELKKMTSNYLEEEDNFFKEQAGILAEKLENNKPCPVCGSLTHPNIARKNKSVLTKEELEKLKLSVENKNKENEKIKNIITEILSKYNTLLLEIEEKNSSDFDIEKYIKSVDEKLEKNSSEIEKSLVNIENIFFDITKEKIKIDKFDFDEFKKKFDEDSEKDKEELIKAKTLYKEYNAQLHEKNKDYEIAEINYKKAYQLLGFPSEEEYKENTLSTKKVEELTKGIEKYNKNVASNKALIKELEKVIKGKEKIDLQNDKNYLEDKKSNFVLIRKEQINKKGILENNKKIYSLLNKNSKELLEKIEEFLVYEELYKTASGTLPGKRRIEFEQYVQAAYFDMVIMEANKRLINMTENRYLLVRKENAEKLTEKIGLDLEIIDNYNGKRRDVRSLSGGESFKAALALALGLSDIIQSYSGGVVVDTLFIDEGFGSLDSDSREQAINTLNSLIDGNKLIGIISHVTELKERIDKKIVVKTSTTGSTINIEI